MYPQYQFYVILALFLIQITYAPTSLLHVPRTQPHPHVQINHQPRPSLPPQQSTIAHCQIAAIPQAIEPWQRFDRQQFAHPTTRPFVLFLLSSWSKTTHPLQHQLQLLNLAVGHHKFHRLFAPICWLAPQKIRPALSHVQQHPRPQFIEPSSKHQSSSPNPRAPIHQPIAPIFMSNTLNLINSDKSDKPTLKKPLQAVPSPLNESLRDGSIDPHHNSIDHRSPNCPPPHQLPSITTMPSKQPASALAPGCRPPRSPR
jgi:hypothetical protein